MPNLSQEKRLRMQECLNAIRLAHREDDAMLMALNEIENELSSKKYGLVWEQHEEVVDVVMRNNIPVFTELRDKEITAAPGKKYNFLLEGDNLHSLRLLEKTHRGRFDLIYIDPPYNTESKDFKYDDNYVDAADGFRHSKWLSFMSERLRLARKLMAKDAAILISINENELFVLKCLCDEIFGAGNYLTTFTVKVRHEDRILKGDKDFHEVTEFLLVYRNTPAFKPLKRLEDNTSLDAYTWKIVEKTDAPDVVQMGNKMVEVFKPGEYDIVKVAAGPDGLKAINIRGSIKTGNSSGRFFVKYLESRMEAERGYLYKVPDMGNDALGERYFCIPEGDRVNGDYYQGVPLNNPDVKEIPYANLLDFEASFNKVGYEGGVNFSNGKKPLDFLDFCFEIANIKQKKDALVLDFFAGSGSTAHALLELNREDGGTRTAVLCTNNEVGVAKEEEFRKAHELSAEELRRLKQSKDARWMTFCEENGICRTVTYPRLCNAINGYEIVQRKKKVKVSGVPANLKYYRAESIPLDAEDVAEALLGHVAEMIQLEQGVHLDGEQYPLILTDEQADVLERRWRECKGVKAVYVSGDVLLTARQNELFSSVPLVVIPDYYFKTELQEAGERW